MHTLSHHSQGVEGKALGKGVVAKTDIPANTIIAFYWGDWVSTEESDKDPDWTPGYMSVRYEGTHGMLLKGAVECPAVYFNDALDTGKTVNCSIREVEADDQPESELAYGNWSTLVRFVSGEEVIPAGTELLVTLAPH